MCDLRPVCSRRSASTAYHGRRDDDVAGGGEIDEEY
jgi:hypothetical protein